MLQPTLICVPSLGKDTNSSLKMCLRRRLTASNFQATSIRSIRSLAPLLDRVLVQRIKAEAKTASGIYLPESSVEKLNEGKVLAVGPGALDKTGNRLPMGVAVGDRVLIPSFGGSPVKAGEEDYHLFRESEILAKINE
ncbi:probable heat shock protein 10 (chaperonin CPN10) [Claviceps purpurea 20.1]|nr:10 kDa heat shock protein [Claviceps purpurea]KAG6149086.1 10 kDa heat shock protein [Claviceps purpurea]KAG6207643.1 10 kDa heat shock protein [Claviceps purpurea]KAG6255441.1 10 kDa heat shock protein [Claviceps purpurea]CCE28136.1 probable heat shock protein 10 (chaperonin CPN10) [Claviceps purpurea 20.1]